jgi:hypothetical protein
MLTSANWTTGRMRNPQIASPRALASEPPLDDNADDRLLPSCPNCEAELNYRINRDKSMTFVCDKCGYEQESDL